MVRVCREMKAPGLAAALALCVMLPASPVVAGNPALCAEVQRVIDRAPAEAKSGAALLALAPYLGEAAVDGLLERAVQRRDDVLESYLALGLSRHASALRALRALPDSADPEQRLGRALGLLALGDGSGSGTIAAALESGSAPIRVRTARGLARLQQMRPKMMLASALEDPEEEVRLAAARALARLEARRVERTLLELRASTSPQIRRAAAAALLERRAQSTLEDAPEAPLHLRLVHRTRALVRGRRARIAAELGAADPLVRASAFAAAALTGEPAAPQLRRLAERARSASPGPSPEALMALALQGDEAASAELPRLEGADAERAIDVLFAYATLAKRGELPPERTRALADAALRWLAAGPSTEGEARVLGAFGRLEPEVGLRLARGRVGSAQGRAARVALDLFGRYGLASDLPLLTARAGAKDTGFDVGALEASARICER